VMTRRRRAARGDRRARVPRHAAAAAGVVAARDRRDVGVAARLLPPLPRVGRLRSATC
jgi:hypothetical protein